MSLVVCSIVQTREISQLWPTKYIKGYKNFEKTVNLWPTTYKIDYRGHKSECKIMQVLG